VSLSGHAELGVAGEGGGGGEGSGRGPPAYQVILQGLRLDSIAVVEAIKASFQVGCACCCQRLAAWLPAPPGGGGAQGGAAANEQLPPLLAGGVVEVQPHVTEQPPPLSPHARLQVVCSRCSQPAVLDVASPALNAGA
jgi:hypothetical protein